MKLNDYLKSLPSADEREAFAKKCGTSLQHMKNVALGYRPCGEKLAIEIEKNSDRAVPCEEMRADVDWAYLRGSQRVAEPTPIVS